MIKSFKDLLVWQRSIELVEEVYKKTNKLPKNEVFGLVSQMRRSAISIPSNIAEGKSRKTKNDYIQFLRIALGSSTELETQIIICEKVYPSISFKKAMILLHLHPVEYSESPNSEMRRRVAEGDLAMRRNAVIGVSQLSLYV